MADATATITMVLDCHQSLVMCLIMTSCLDLQISAFPVLSSTLLSAAPPNCLLWIAYDDLKAASDSVNLLPKMADLFKSLCGHA